MSLEERKQRGLELLDEMLGEETAESTRAAWRNVSPDFEQYVVEFLSGEIWSRPHLDRKTRSLITIGSLMTLGRSRGLELNIRMALRNGATRKEIMESILHLAPYAGFPAAWEALAIARGVFENS